jgi:transposase-like protein
MKPTPHTPEFKEQALRKLRERGARTQQSIADELNISLATVKGWLQSSRTSVRGVPHGAPPLPSDVPAQHWTPVERLQALLESYTLTRPALHAWCRERGLFEHQLRAWREGFCLGTEPDARQGRVAMRDLQTKHEQLQRDMPRKDKALAEAAALLVLQKKFQALWADEV